MPLIRINELSIRYRGPALLDEVSCIIEPGQRIGLLGRNGAGKSTLLKILDGSVAPDHGSVQRNGTVAMLPQEVPQDLAGTVFEVVRQGLSQASEKQPESNWELDHKVDRVLSNMSLDPEATVQTMSSGMKRRVLLARALADSPDLLLLDEPTNHLDIESIRWLEDHLDRWNQAFMFITHDRQFLRRLADRILEIDRGKLFDWTCDYDTFLRRKEEALAAEEKQNALFDKKLAEEEAWIRQGIKARRTRNEGRVRALKELRKVRSDRREQSGTSQIRIQEADRSGNLVIEAKKLSFAHKAIDANSQDRAILKDFSTTIMRGDRVGIIGPNGAGKTTLLRLLLGKLEPDQGNIRLGANLQIAYFDQLREQLNDSNTVEQEVADGYQTVNINGASRHVLGYLQDFLFTAERARTPISRLSGGERNRILLAKLFAKPANLIILDEPTNDLDAESLEMLEERLGEFQGTILVVSHDREFLNNVASSCIVFEQDPHGNEIVKEYVGGYDDWQQQRPSAPQETSTKKEKGTKTSSEPAKKQSSGSNANQPSAPPKRKLTFKETKELESLPAKIEELETQISAIHEAMADPSFYQQDGDTIASEQEKLSSLNKELETSYARWEELES